MFLKKAEVTIIIFLFVISCTNSGKENLNLDKTIKDSISLTSIHEKSTFLFKNNKIDSSLYYDRLLNRKSKELSNDYYLGISHANIGYYFRNIHIYDSAYFNYNKSKTYFIKLKDSSKAGKRLLSMGLIQKNQNDFFGSKETLTEALKYLHPKKDKKYVASNYNLLGTNHRKLLNFNDAEKYILKAIDKAPSSKDKLAYKNNLSATYIDDKRYNDAISILQQVKGDTTLKRTSNQYARILDNLAYAQWLSGEKINKQSFFTPLRIRKKNNDKRGQISSYTHLGEFYTKTNPRKATSYFDSVIQISKILKIPRAEKDALKLLMQLEPKNINVRNRYIHLQDSLYVKELKVKTQFAKYKYDDKVTQEANLRLEKENAEKELEVAKQRNQKLAFSAIGGLLLLTLVFLSYYFVQRTKRLKKEKETVALNAMHETEAELSRRLHDDFGGKLNNAMVMLQNKTDTAEVLDVVDELYNQSRDFSREINVVDTGENFEEELLEMLRFRTPSAAKLIHSGITDIKWPSIAPISKTTLFKVLQELMINMGKYSNATLISIGFSATPKALKVDYADDGDGATTKELQTKNGLRNTEKRIQALKGNITFDSEKRNGFRAEIKIPK